MNLIISLLIAININYTSKYLEKSDNIYIEKSIQDSTLYYTSKMKNAINKSALFPYASYKSLKKSILYFKKKKDTNRAINGLIKMSQIQKQKRNYSKTFDHLWEAKYLSDLYHRKDQKVTIRISLARLYDNFNLTEQSVTLLEDASSIAKEIYFEDNQKTENLISSYMYMAVRHRKSGNYKTALAYLDSCYINDKINLKQRIDMPFWDAEKGKIMQKIGRNEEAGKYLHEARDLTQNLIITYRPNISMYLGDLKYSINQLDSANYYYKESLNLTRRKGFNNDLEGEVLLKISKVYDKKKKTKLAYRALSESITIEAETLKDKNRTNSELFEIKNTYLNSISEKNEELEKQNIIIEKNNQIQFRLKVILGLLLLLGIISYTFIQMRLKLKKTLLDKKEAQIKAESNKKKSENEIELKSKELTSYALQLVDKDSAIDELLDVLKTEASQKYKNLYYKYKKGSKDLWDDFNLQFTSINSAFYNKLETLHPKLSTTEQKHCALIKLNLGTKEMARILNIEAHSVHVSRSRIRKKIGLQRSENLEKYIGSL
ncbi:tetratricopeptide repeat protein [Maribacter vaceletii]|nr:tetratricopeptide repeat protein [Maribacter vaceletii]